jgi:uncharacterized protein YjbI with pentapeptide repeats
MSRLGHPVKALIKSLSRLQVERFFERVGRTLVAVVLCLVGLWFLRMPAAIAVDYDKEILIGSDFSGQVLTDASFTKANLRDSNFSGADLKGVSFFSANLESANLSNTDLRSAILDTARLTNANLTNANLEGAFAFNARFNGAAIAGADFTDVDLRTDMQKLLCAIATGKNPVTGRETKETLGCL